MSDDDLRAKAEELRDSAQAWIDNEPPPNEFHDDRTDSETVDYWRLQVAVAKGLLERLVPADDAEPVTADWLAAQGWTSDGYSYPFWSPPAALRLGSTQAGVYTGQSGSSRLVVNCHTVAQPATRGAVRRLLRALGVTTT